MKSAMDLKQNLQAEGSPPGAWIARMGYLGLAQVYPSKILQFSDYRAMRDGH